MGSRAHVHGAALPPRTKQAVALEHRPDSRELLVVGLHQRQPQTPTRSPSRFSAAFTQVGLEVKNSVS